MVCLQDLFCSGRPAWTPTGTPRALSRRAASGRSFLARLQAEGIVMPPISSSDVCWVQDAC